MKKIFVFFLILRLVGLFVLPAAAQETDFVVADSTSLNLSAAAIQKGFNFVDHDKTFLLAIKPELLKTETTLTLTTYETDDVVFPDGWDSASLIYEFSFDKSVGNNYQQETVMQISAGSDIMDLKRIFSWDEDDGKWVENISTSRNARDVRLNVKLIGGKFVVLTTKKAMEFGAASWYKYKNCDCAASPDYPKGTRLKVTNLDNNKSLIVKVNDWGPERDKHPERVIDLDKTAFKKLGSLSRGILKNVRVELVKN